MLPTLLHTRGDISLRASPKFIEKKTLSADASIYHGSCRGYTLTSSSLFYGDVRLTMTPTSNGADHVAGKSPDPRLARPRRRRYFFLAAVGLLLLTLLALAFTVFRLRDPTTTLVSAAVDGVAPRLSCQRLDFDLNVTLLLQLRVKNTNYAGFRRRRSRCYVILAAVGRLLLALAFTVFRRSDPTTTLVSTAVDGVAPPLCFPRLDFDLNVALRLQLRVKNPNYVGFRHAAGKSFVYYRGRAIGDADVAPGMIPARGSEDVSVRLTLQVDRFAYDLGQLFRDALAGEFGVDVLTTVPGKVTFVRIVRRHAVAMSECHVVVGFPDLKIKSQECKHRTNL